MNVNNFEETYDFSGQVAVVTGAAGEIGLLIARTIAARVLFSAEAVQS